tara:strand:+ start:13654 stop:14688 length:1035 start_codon:yes stop_codon:yes gene_type:complete
MKIGISYWGFCEKFQDSTVSNTPDGHRYGRPVLVDALLESGHEVYALQDQREDVKYDGLDYRFAGDGYPDLDVLFVEWRWPTYKNSGENKFEPDLDRQTQLLDYYHGNIPIVSWDTDLKMTADDEVRWPLMTIADPSFDPKHMTRDRLRLTFWSDFRQIIDTTTGPVEFGYVGNNYERDKMFMEYYSKPSLVLRDNGVQTKVHGNWLQRSPERSSPEDLIRMHPNIAFGKRVSFHDSMHLLNEFICTVHITKPGYADVGFASPRYLENIVVGTPALVPYEFKYSSILGEEWVVHGHSDVIEKVRYLKNLGCDERDDVVRHQMYNLLKHHNFSVNNVVEFIESLV